MVCLVNGMWFVVAITVICSKRLTNPSGLKMLEELDLGLATIGINHSNRSLRTHAGIADTASDPLSPYFQCYFDPVRICVCLHQGV
jgi:hypothetical protein